MEFLGMIHSWMIYSNDTCNNKEYIKIRLRVENFFKKYRTYPNKTHEHMGSNGIKLVHFNKVWNPGAVFIKHT